MIAISAPTHAPMTMYVVLLLSPVLVSVSFGGLAVGTEDVVDGLDVETCVTDVVLSVGIVDEVATKVHWCVTFRALW